MLQGFAGNRSPAVPAHEVVVAVVQGLHHAIVTERFQALVGCGPLTYLAEWRLQKARALLQDNRISVQEIAGRVGYQSPAAFTRAFANMFGESPTRFRANLAA